MIPDKTGSRNRLNIASPALLAGSLALLLVSGVTLVTFFGDGSAADAANWIEALATAAAFAAAVVAARYAAGVYALEEDRDRRREDAEQRHQAEAVAAWGERGGGMTRSGGILRWTWQVRARNASPLPLYDCRIALRTTMQSDNHTLDLKHSPLPIRVLPPTGTETLTVKKLPIEIAVRDLLDRAAIPDNFDSELILNLAVVMVFRDTGNRWWRRTEDGILEGPFSKAPLAIA